MAHRSSLAWCLFLFSTTTLSVLCLASLRLLGHTWARAPVVKGFQTGLIDIYLYIYICDWLRHYLALRHQRESHCFKFCSQLESIYRMTSNQERVRFGLADSQPQLALLLCSLYAKVALQTTHKNIYNLDLLHSVSQFNWAVLISSLRLNFTFNCLASCYLFSFRLLAAKRRVNNNWIHLNGSTKRN